MYLKDSLLTVLVFGVLINVGGTRLVDAVLLGLLLCVFLMIPMLGVLQNWFNPFDD